MKLFDPFCIAQEMIARVAGYRVSKGPFRGLRYDPRLEVGNALHAKLLGLYEVEIEPWIVGLRGGPFDAIVDIGGAEGFYAVGFALMFPSSRIIAYEQDETAREAIARMAELNRVRERMDIRGYCDRAELAAVLSPDSQRSFVLMDIEGGERELLDPVQVPALQRATILCETHDAKVPECASVIKERFDGTHRISEIQSRARKADELPAWVPSFATRWFVDASSDFRNIQQSWLLLEPILSFDAGPVPPAPVASVVK